MGWSETLSTYDPDIAAAVEGGDKWAARMSGLLKAKADSEAAVAKANVVGDIIAARDAAKGQAERAAQDRNEAAIELKAAIDRAKQIIDDANAMTAQMLAETKAKTAAMVGEAQAEVDRLTQEAKDIHAKAETTHRQLEIETENHRLATSQLAAKTDALADAQAAAEAEKDKWQAKYAGLVKIVKEFAD